MHSPRLTIITSTFNCANCFQKTADSIRQQTSKNIQWIVADGASSDGTVDLIRANDDIISHWISESDRGIYDAWNKACNFIDGDWVLFLGAGDELANKDVFEEFVSFVDDLPDSTVVVYGNVQIVKPDGRLRYIDRKPKLNYWEFGRPALPHHQGVFHAKTLFERTENFDISYKIAGDSDFLMYSLTRGVFKHFDITVSRMSDDGVSNSYKNTFKTRCEISKICKKHGVKVPYLHRLVSDLNWVLRYLSHSIIPDKAKSHLQNLRDSYRKKLSLL